MDKKKLHQILSSLWKNNDSVGKMCYNQALQDVQTAIDLQEEPKFKTGDRIKPIDSCLGSPRTIVDICDSWYVTDQGTLDFEYEDNWELAEEHKKCMYLKDNYTNEDRKVLCDGCKEECEYSKKEEPVSERFAFKAIPRLLEMIEPTDRAKVYVTKLADALEVEGYSTDAKIVMESLKIMNGEKVPMATMDEEPVSKDLEKAAVEAFKQIVDSDKNNFLEIFKAGAEWQKTKDESTTEDLGEYINELSKQFPEVSFAKLSRIAVRVAKWQKTNLWKPADGEDLPEYDREVIVLIKYNAQRNIHDEEYPTYRVGFGHRPDPKGWDGKSVTTGKVEHYTPKTYDKGGWNIPDVVYFLDVKLPKEIEL